MLAVQNIVKRFGGLVAVDGCSLEIPKGAITALIGPNGAGKTTLFNIIAGFIKSDEGKILLEDRDVTNLSPHRMVELGLVRTFQIPHELARMTVLENLMVAGPNQAGETLFSTWFRRAHVRHEERLLRARADQVLELLEIGHVSYELAGHLSGGQKKLLELGRAMMSEPRIVLLDEPGAGVNRTLLAKLSGAIRRLNEEEGLTFLIVEHDMDLIAELCNPVICMAEGRTLAVGTMEEIRANPLVIEAYFGTAA